MRGETQAGDREKKSYGLQPTDEESAPSFSPIINNLISFFLIHPLLSNSKKKGGGAVRQARNLQRALAARRPALSIMISMSMKAPLTPAP